MSRPIISTYQDLAKFMADMLAFRRKQEKHFSILRACQNLRRVSPTLVSLLLKRQRKVTLDRVDELAKLLGLSFQEKQYFKDWVQRLEGKVPVAAGRKAAESLGRRKAASSHILSDWINVYVKDAFQLLRVKRNPAAIYAVLAGVASQKRIDKAMTFLLREGYLRRSVDGSVVEDTPLHVVDRRVPDQKVRQFHKGVLKTALQAIDQHPPSRRYANALILPLDERAYQELTHMIEEMAERLQGFAEQPRDGDALYQLVINLSPTGGGYE